MFLRFTLERSGKAGTSSISRNKILGNRLVQQLGLCLRNRIMTDFNRTVSSTSREPLAVPPTYREPLAVAPRMAMTTTGPIFSSLDMIAGIAAAVMTLGPLAMAAFSVGRY